MYRVESIPQKVAELYEYAYALESDVDPDTLIKDQAGNVAFLEPNEPDTPYWRLTRYDGTVIVNELDASEDALDIIRIMEQHLEN